MCWHLAVSTSTQNNWYWIVLTPLHGQNDVILANFKVISARIRMGWQLLNFTTVPDFHQAFQRHYPGVNQNVR